MLYIPSKQTKPSAKKLFNASDTKFTIYQTLIRKSALFMYQHHTNSLPKVFYNFFSKATNKNIVTRSNSQIISIHCSSAASIQSAKFWGPKVGIKFQSKTEKGNDSLV